jgi:hypothetical protein
MAIKQPTSYTARREISLDGVTYGPGDTVPNEVVRGLRTLSALVSARILVPDTDPHSRRTSIGTPTPTDFSARSRAAIPDNV